MMWAKEKPKAKEIYQKGSVLLLACLAFEIGLLFVRILLFE